LGVDAAKAIGNALEHHSDIKVIHGASDHVCVAMYCKCLNHIYMCVSCYFEGTFTFAMSSPVCLSVCHNVRSPYSGD